ncbi:copper ion transmembrane transporters [Striga asiatica]|uniref:Copper ion transmembrane transporters n=1 Tax=Striga asiatica TaxID=4170 RepID=A0A5A7PAB3_STRAF|nr:copper ion transmembrane transporters [Striga asiatica]
MIFVKDETTHLTPSLASVSSSLGEKDFSIAKILHVKRFSRTLGLSFSPIARPTPVPRIFVVLQSSLSAAKLSDNKMASSKSESPSNKPLSSTAKPTKKCSLLGFFSVLDFADVLFSSSNPESLSSAKALSIGLISDQSALQAYVFYKLANHQLTTSIPDKLAQIRMDRGRVLNPNNVSKWRWKRIQAKKSKQLLKSLPGLRTPSRPICSPRAPTSCYRCWRTSFRSPTGWICGWKGTCRKCSSTIT